VHRAPRQNIGRGQEDPRGNGDGGQIHRPYGPQSQGGDLDHAQRPKGSLESQGLRPLRRQRPPLKIGFIIYNGMTALDLVGIYDPLTRLKTMGFLASLSWDICGIEPKVADSSGLSIVPTAVGVPLSGYNLIVIPGGPTAKKLAQDETFIQWIKTAEPCPLKVSVCSGALLLGATRFI